MLHDHAETKYGSHRANMTSYHVLMYATQIRNMSALKDLDHEMENGHLPDV